MINQESLFYELGVLMFHVMELKTDKEEFDMVENFNGITQSFGAEFSLDFLKDGFLAEASNHPLSKESALIYFDVIKERLEDI